VRGRFAPFIIGTGLLALAAAMVVFVIYALLAREPVLGFLVTAVASTLVGAPLARFGSARAEPTRREALVGVLLLWFLMPLFGAIPYAMSDAFTPLNALFESMSGFTATGATVLVDFTKPSSTLFMWRSLTQWFGGIGILLLFIAVFPQLAIAGRQLFFTEAPGPTEERLTPRLRNTAYAVLIVYAGLTTLCALAYLAAGTFQAPLIEWVAIVFMLFAGANFALQYRAVTGRPRELMRDAEFRAYLVIVAIATATLTLFLWRGEAFWETLRTGLFQVLSILTTTGYASVDYALWDQRAQMVLLVLMFIGGSAGSAAGGIKIARWLIIGQNTAREVRQALHPRAVLPVRVGDRVVPEEVIRAVAAFLTLFVGLFALSVVVLVAFGADFVTAFSASIAAVGNIGPGLASVGPMLNFAELHPVSRGVLIFDMYAGRLEVVTVFVIFTSNWWRLPRRATFGSRR
jgi:trk system potassium uptake protein TrkH